ncbi:MAG TPA: peptidoglycan DD-metalloendopeptidase family protein [Polyangiales bacterium]|nr:peptidoglycan DD-metalloendopeptidase family protein [Polyangiales bacterium]
MKRTARISLVACILISALSVERAARGESTAPLRGIGADLAAARMLEESEQKHVSDDQLANQLSELEVQQMQAKQTLRTRVRALYRITRAGMAPIAGGFEAVRRHVARIKRMTLLVRADLNALHALATREQGIRTQAAAQAAARAAKAREQLDPAPKQLLVRPLPAAAAAATRTPSSGAFYGIRFSDDNDTTGFAVQQGKLAAPVGGEVRVVEARRSESSGSGLEFQAPGGTSVRAAAAGRVAFSDRYGSYGRLVILDHGDGYYTAYGGLGSVDVRVGDDVSGYARLGSIAAEGGTPALYFEVRKGTKTLPARQWLGM